MANLKTPVNEKDHVQGNPDAPVELVEYGDFQCSHCGRAYPEIKRIQKRLGKDLKFVFRNFPLTNVHQNAKHAALAAEAAAAQGKFWEMHDMLFENQQNLEDEDLIEYAEKIGLDVEEFKNDLENQAYMEKVESDFESGMRSGVNATPTFFVNGERYDDILNEESLLMYSRSR